MIIPILLLATPPAYMQHAAYPAGSLVEDTEAPGGFGTSDNFPKQFTPGRYPNLLTISRTDEKISIAIANQTNETLWFRAADGNLIAWLEAKDGNTWKPIQYHNWYTCGNSYHRVALQTLRVFTYSIPIPTGSLKTEVRFAISQSSSEGTNKPLYSHTIETTINPNLFKLDPEKFTDQKLTTEWVTPTVVPKSLNFDGMN